MTVTLYAMGEVVLLLSAAIGIGRVSQQRQIDREIDALLATAPSSVAPSISEADLTGLPEPVQRWMRWSGVVGNEGVGVVRLKQQGRFQLEGRGWFPFEADQYFITQRPAFLWRVSMQMFPLVKVYGRDRYADGEGGMQIKVLSLVPVVDKTGEGLNQGALLRYLGETIWFPSGALSPHIVWRGINDDAAEATMTYGGVSASATFLFDAAGRPTVVEAQRYNDSRGEILPWKVTSTAFGERGGVRMPVEGIGTWEFEEGEFDYVELRVTTVDYNVPSRY